LGLGEEMANQLGRDDGFMARVAVDLLYGLLLGLAWFLAQFLPFRADHVSFALYACAASVAIVILFRHKGGKSQPPRQ
jgi:hypothetical protein